MNNFEKLPTLQTPRLILRPFKMTDVTRVTQLANDFDIALNTENFPYPYEEFMAHSWILQHQDFFQSNQKLILAITKRKNEQLIGAIGLDIDLKHDRAGLGYWLGRPFWKQGYATEAAKRMLYYSFEELKLQRVFALHLKRNPDSARVLQKIDMQYEGCQRQHIKKFDQYEDAELYGILRSDYMV